MASLVAIAGSMSGRRFMLAARTRIGRASENTIVLVDHLVSREHAEIVQDGDGYVLRDLGSKNGVLVNGLPVAETVLHDGDRIQIGETVFQFDAAAPALAARYSDVSVGVETHPGVVIRTAPRPAGPESPAARAGELIGILAHLFDCEPDALPDALNVALRRLLQVFDASAGSLMLRTSSGETTPLVAAAPLGSPTLLLPREAVRRALEGTDPVLAAFEDRAPGAAPSGGERRKVLLMPLAQRDRTLGLFHLERAAGREFTGPEVALIRSLAPLLAGIVRQLLLREQLRASAAAPSEPFIGVSEAAAAVREQIRRIAANDATVLITGETGTGKELAARAIHAASARASGPMVVIDCSTIPANLLESELFGHEAGAFTGADRLKRGKIEMAEGGTLFLDEIGELDPALQPKLLRFIEELSFYRVGGVRAFPADVRLIAATNRNLQQAVEAGRFREDLYFRLHVMTLHLPPLRDRPEDIRPLVEYFAPRLAARLGKPFLGLTDDAWTLLQRYRWPGNVRELRHGLERAMILSDDGTLRPEHFQLTLPESAAEASTSGRRSISGQETRSGGRGRPAAPLPLAQVEAEAIRRALRYTGGNRIHAARILQIHRNTLAKKIQEYGIEV